MGASIILPFWEIKDTRSVNVTDLNRETTETLIWSEFMDVPFGLSNWYRP